MAKKTACPKLSADHPMRVAGFIHEDEVRDAWAFSDSYFREWLRTNNVPHRLVASARWFHRDSLVEWFNGESGACDEVPQ